MSDLFHLPVPLFLPYEFGLVACLLAWVWGHRLYIQRAPGSKPRPQLNQFSTYDLAFLVGGPGGVIKTAVFALDLKGIYNFVKSDKANLGAFLTFHMRKENVTNDRPSGPYNSNLGFAFAIGLTPEVFLTDVFALTAELGLTIRVQEGFAAGFTGDNILGGFGFHYYF